MPDNNDTMIPRADGTVERGSTMFGISIRGWIAIGLTATVCSNHLAITLSTCVNAIRTSDFTMLGTLTTIGEPLYSMSVAALGFYFGQKSQPKTP